MSKVFVESFNQSMARLLDTKEVMSLVGAHMYARLRAI